MKENSNPITVTPSLAMASRVRHSFSTENSHKPPSFEQTPKKRKSIFADVETLAQTSSNSRNNSSVFNSQLSFQQLTAGNSSPQSNSPPLHPAILGLPFSGLNHWSTSAHPFAVSPPTSFSTSPIFHASPITTFGPLTVTCPPLGGVSLKSYSPVLPLNESLLPAKIASNALSGDHADNNCTLQQVSTALSAQLCTINMTSQI